MGEGTGIKKQVQNRQGGVKNSIGNGEAKELISTTHGHEVTGGLLEGMGAVGEGGQRGKLGHNSIINKIHLKAFKHNQ